MDQIICFKHSYYVGNETPELNCQACCKIFIDGIKAHNARHRDASPEVGLEQAIPALKVSNFSPISI